MILNISELAEELEYEMTLQQLPVVLDFEDYEHFIKKAIKKLFIDTGRALQYSSEFITEDDDGNTILNYNIDIDEQAYILLLAKIEFYKFAQNDKNAMFNYTTDALSVTNADKPYANIKNTIEKLENERRITYYKMHRYALG